MKSLLMLLLCGALSVAIPAAADEPHSLGAGRLHAVRVLSPPPVPKGMVIHFSDRSGWTSLDDAIAAALVKDGDIVLGVDLSTYATELDKSDGECLYVVAEITDLTQMAQRQLGVQTYLPPILTGRGEGATFAYAALADAPANTLGGAVASGFTNRLTLRQPFCPGSKATRTADGKAFSYGFDVALPETATLLVDQKHLNDVATQVAGQSGIEVRALQGDGATDQIVSEVATVRDAIEPFGKLPAVDLPSGAPPKAVAIFVSGDGGWRDLDKTIGEWLTTQGVHVVGLDALHYFWSKRTPEELAADVTSLVSEADPTDDLPVALIGYSFGADTLPFAYPLLPPRLKERTKVIALLAPGRSTSFQVTVSGWLGIDDQGYDIGAALAGLPPERVICFYGKDETDSGCLDSRVRGITTIATEGGHHFGGDYLEIAQRLLDAID